MTALYIITRYVTFPGAFIRCFYEHIMLKITKTPVEDDRYIRDDEMSSHIEHELIKGPTAAFFTALIPCLLCLWGALLMAMCPVVFRPTSVAGTVFTGLSVWFAVSLLSNCFPSVEDALNLADRIYRKGNLFQKIIFAPFFAVLFVGAYAERYSVSFFGAMAAVMAVFVF